MKKTLENRYQHSATLFKFCKEALEIRYEGNVKVIDQDVGAILGYDPADCSHWKKGKKNIRALSTLRSIADHLNIDEKLLIDIAGGKIELEEAIFEYKGYGKFFLRGQNLETLKKEFFKNPSKWQGEGGVRSFEDLFNVEREKIAQTAVAILTAGAFTEAPIYLPEIYQMFHNLSLEGVEDLQKTVEVEYTGEGQGLKANVRYRGTQMRPYIRYLVAKELYKFLVRSRHEMVATNTEVPPEVLDVQSNVFAGMILVPYHLLKAEVESIDSSLDLVQQLADTFWVSKSLMNQRLRDLMENLN